MPGMNDLETPVNSAEEIYPEISNGPGDLPQFEESLEFTKPDDKDTVTFRRSHLYALLIPLTFVLGLSVGYLFWGRPATPTASLPASEGAANDQSSSGQAGTTSQSENSENQFENIVRYNIPTDGAPILGPENAAITIVEFSDYECPYCQKWHAEVFNRLQNAYAGQIRFAYRDFPLTNIHPNAFSAAEAAHCAGDQDAYWLFHDQLFIQDLGLGNSAYQQYAQRLGLHMPTFNACLDDRKFQAKVQADFDFAAQLGIRSTPTFFINGIALVGAQSFETFQQIIDNELAGNIP
jgi:protein-disulfide isomerase